VSSGSAGLAGGVIPPVTASVTEYCSLQYQMQRTGLYKKFLDVEEESMDEQLP